MTIYIPARLESRYQNHKIGFEDLQKKISQEGAPSRYLVVAPYGAGKSRLCREIYNSFIKASSKNIHLFRGKEISTNGDTLEQIKESGFLKNSVVIIDALDEIVDYSTLSSLFKTLNKIRGRLLLTSRVTFLDTLTEKIWPSEYRPTLGSFLDHFQLNLYDLLPFSEDDAVSFLLKNHINENEVEKLKSHKLWHTIVAHPLWLTILVDVLGTDPQGKIINLWGLLESHIEQLVRKSHLGATLKDLFQETALAIAASIPIYHKNVIFLDREYWSLVEKTGTTVSFKHRIFYDYFLVRAIVKEFYSKDVCLLNRILLNDVQIQLLNDALDGMGYDDILALLKDARSSFIPPKTDYIGSNVVSLFRARGYDLAGAISEYESFHSVMLNDIHLAHLHLKNVCFKNASMNGSTIENSSFTKCNFEGTDFGDKLGTIDLDAKGNLLCCVTHSGIVYLLSVNDNSFDVIASRQIDLATACSVTNEVIIIGFVGGAVQIFDMQLRPLSSQEPVHTDRVMDIASDERYIISCSCDGTISIWNIDSGVKKRIQAHKDIAHGVDINSTREACISVGYDGDVAIFSCRSGKIVNRKRVSDSSLYTCKFDKYGKRIAIGGFGGVFALIDTDSFDVVENLKPDHRSTIWGLEWVCDNEILLTGWDKSVCLFTPKDNNSRKMDFPCYNSKCISINNNVIITSSSQQTISLVDIHRNAIISTMVTDQAHDIKFNDVLFEKCYGLSPLRNELLQKAGAEILLPVDSAQGSFSRKRPFFYKKGRKPVPRLSENLLHLNIDEYNEYKFSEEFYDLNYINEVIVSQIDEVQSLLNIEGVSDRSLVESLRELSIELKAGNRKSKIEYSKVLERLSNLNGASQVVTNGVQVLNQLIMALPF